MPYTFEELAERERRRWLRPAAHLFVRPDARGSVDCDPALLRERLLHPDHKLWMRFPLDALWASPAIDAVGIDYYAPLSDWRDTADHLDRQLANTIYDRGYLARNIRAGEGFDWYYANNGERAVQARTPITDGLGKP